jgi:hypothetical protein
VLPGSMPPAAPDEEPEVRQGEASEHDETTLASARSIVQIKVAQELDPQCRRIQVSSAAMLSTEPC